MSPEMGRYTLADDIARMAAHVADADAHHPEEIPLGRVIIGGISHLVIPSVGSRTVSAVAENLNRIFYHPIIVTTPITIANLFIEVTVAGGGGTKAMLGIYSADINWQPVTLQLASVAVAIDAIAVVSGVYAVTLQEGRYLTAYLGEDTATLRTIRCSLSFASFKRTLGASPLWADYWAGLAYGAMPVDGVAPTNMTFSTIGFVHPVFIDVATP